MRHNGALRTNLQPCSCPLLLAFFNMLESPIAHWINKYGESGSPWRRPRPGQIGPTSPSLTINEYKTEQTHFHQSNLFLTKSHLSKNATHKYPINTNICFRDVNFKCHVTLLPFSPILHRMKCFKCNQDIFLDEPPRNKRRL